jgi:ankyrin repeat protein
MRRVFAFAVVVASILSVCCSKKERAIAMPAADFAGVHLLWQNVTQWTFHKDQQIVKVGIGNSTPYEIATINADFILLDGAGNEVSRTPFVMDKFTDNFSLYQGTMLPRSMGNSGRTLKMLAPEHYRVEFRSATYFAKGEDLSDFGHLYAAVYRGDSENVKKKIDDDKETKTAKDPVNGMMLVHVAATCDNVDVVTHLIDMGVDYDVAGKNGWTPLHCALNSGANNVALFLLNRGAKPETKRSSATSLELAVRRCSGDVVHKLIAMGADPNAQMGRRANALETAAAFGNGEAVKVLIAHGADPNHQDRGHTPPLFHAVTGNQAAVIPVLIKSGAKVDELNTNGYTALMISAGQASGDVVQALIDNGAYLHAKAPDGKTALEIAEQYNNVEAAVALRAALAETKK